MSYTLDELKRLPSKTNWELVDSLTDEDVDRLTEGDPEWEGVDDIDWSKAELVIPSAKTAISIRLDADVLAFFKAGGPGYQGRINAVLKSYMKASRKA